MTGKVNTNLIHRLPRPECIVAFGTVYPTVSRIVVLKNKTVSVPTRVIIKMGEPHPAHSPW